MFSVATGGNREKRFKSSGLNCDDFKTNMVEYAVPRLSLMFKALLPSLNNHENLKQAYNFVMPVQSTSRFLLRPERYL